jgi:hypothetical protein
MTSGIIHCCEKAATPTPEIKKSLPIIDVLPHIFRKPAKTTRVGRLHRKGRVARSVFIDVVIVASVELRIRKLETAISTFNNSPMDDPAAIRKEILGGVMN